MADRRGSAALEFALVASVLITLLLATFDIGLATLQYAQINAAVRAGGQYAMSFPTDNSGIEAAVTNALPNNLQGSVTTTTGCECLSGPPTGSCNIPPGSCGACRRGTQRFIQVSTIVKASAATWFTPPLAITKLTAPSACYVARIQ